MFGRVFINEVDHFVLTLQESFTVLPNFFLLFFSRQHTELLIPVRQHLFCNAVQCGYEDHLAVGAMFGLREEVGGDEAGLALFHQL